MWSIQRTLQKVLDSLQVQNTQPQKLLECLDILSKLFSNIASNPLQNKYRYIKTSNPTLRNKVFNIENIEKVLTILGYTKHQQNYILTDQNLQSLIEGGPLIQWKRRLLQARYKSPEAYKQAVQYVKNQKQNKARRQRQMKQTERLKNMAQNDKKQRKHMRIDTSNSNPLSYGKNEKTWKDIGVDLCKKGS